MRTSDNSDKGKIRESPFHAQTDSLIRLLMAVTPLAGTLLAESHVVTFR
jgi:hypothetical protein